MALFSRVLLRSCQPYHGTQGMDCYGGPQRMAPGFEGSAASGCQVADGGEKVEDVTRFTSAASPTQWNSPHTSVERSSHWTLAGRAGGTCKPRCGASGGPRTSGEATASPRGVGGDIWTRGGRFEVCFGEGKETFIGACRGGSDHRMQGLHCAGREVSG